MIHIENLYKYFGDTVALNGVNLDIQKEEVVVLKGKSGSGKSTLLSLLSGMSKPTSGKIVIDGTQIHRLSERFAAKFRLENIGFIFQKYNLFAQMDIKENLAIPLIPLHLSKEEITLRIDTLLESFELEEKKDTLVKHLSGGEQQRVAIARSLINDPKIIIADEPTANLDEALSLRFIEILRQLKEQNKTILIATHDPLFFNLDFVDRIIEIKGGQCF
ncbi:MAG: ABC transporter ATP-binding protein [Epsilonproteobacteria bacterium]|nr:ABC transporter ATP-binding protein [Campylobacterota bacterium]